MRILVTGGAGYIGSHTVVVLADYGHTVTLLDNFSRSSRRIPALIGGLLGSAVDLVDADLRDATALDQVFSTRSFDAVIHFAAYKSISESLSDPLAYYDNNVGGTLELLRAMRRFSVSRLVFSSTAAVYGAGNASPVNESAPRAGVNPYARSKAMMEDAILDFSRAVPGFGAAVLRYFNPVGAHPSGELGEAPSVEMGNLMPILCDVAAGEREQLLVYGADYPTADGTGVRDYLHVMDLAEAHVAALQRLNAGGGSLVVNVGTGKGCSVLELIKTFEAVNGCQISHRLVDRRAGDVAQMYADVQLSSYLLGWRARRGLAEMCKDAWRWRNGGYPALIRMRGPG